MAKLVDALALGASGVTHGGSSPLPSTLFLMKDNLTVVFHFIKLDSTLCYYDAHARVV
jgi:hypothetical protein